MDYKKREHDLTSIFMAGVNRVDPCLLIEHSIRCVGKQLVIDTGSQTEHVDLSAFDRIFIIGFGKATAKMARAMEAILGDRITEGVISVKYGHTEKLQTIRMIEAGHPVPDANGLKAARAIADLAARADEKTLVMTLISGGGSALIPYPWDDPGGDIKAAVTLAEKQAVTRTLLACGATIKEVNTVRKHLSRIKGGRLAALTAPATSISLILSDVVGDPLDVIASGATSPDPSTFRDMQAVFDRYGIIGQIPDSVLEILHAGLKNRIPETPKPGDPIFDRVRNRLIGTNILALEAAKQAAERLGYRSRVLTSQLVGEAKEVAKVLCAIAKEVQKQQARKEKFCLLFGGETTVTVKGNGKGGRNQELALSFLSEMAADPDATDRIGFLSGGTDGNDGPTDAAGAFAHLSLVDRAKKKGLTLEDHLTNNDAYPFFDAIGGLLKTGPTNTNVCDIQVILVG
ncbi:MAG: glycerate kinase [bacterium]